MTTLFKPLILAGGSGTRLWPLSREQRPKQFLPLAGPETMLQQTLGRLAGAPHEDPIVICNAQHRFLVAEQLRQIGLEDTEIILEPVGRNTAPAIALGALLAMAQGDDPILLVLPADHLITDTPAFHDAIGAATTLAEQGKIATFGIIPRHAETAYGYIRAGAPVAGQGLAVKQFVEKPDIETAQSYIASGDYYWNSGMFIFRASRYLQELEAFRPDILSACKEALGTSRKDLIFSRINEDAFAACPSESIDYAVMEHTADAVVVPLEAGWDDLGAWGSIASTMEKDADGNTLRGDVLAEQTQNTLVRAENRLVVTLGVGDLIVVETKDAVLVAHKDKAQDVKRIVERLRAEGRTEHLQHREVFRPWGVYDSVDKGDRYQVKRITVRPGGRLSVQMHYHRAEHWVVVSGTARVTCGEKTYLVTENESTFIPVGETHCLENPGRVPLELIEIQSGAYLGEDDIVRIDDVYGRA